MACTSGVGSEVGSGVDSGVGCRNVHCENSKPEEDLRVSAARTSRVDSGVGAGIGSEVGSGVGCRNVHSENIKPWGNFRSLKEFQQHSPRELVLASEPGVAQRLALAWAVKTCIVRTKPWRNLRN